LLFGKMPVEDGWIDMESIRGYAVSKNYTNQPGSYSGGQLFLGWFTSNAAQAANAIGVGIDNEGIYADMPGWNYYLFSRLELEKSLELPGKFPKFPGAYPNRGDEGSLYVREAAEEIINGIRSAPPTAGKTPTALDILNQVRLGTSPEGVQLGGGVLGTIGDDNLPKNFVDLADKKEGKNRIVISDDKTMGEDLAISSPEILAARGGFQTTMEDENGKPQVMKGTTGEINLLNLNFHLKGLATLTITMTVYVESGSIKDVNFGNISVLTEDNMAAVPGPKLKE
jgi:hypothetical protein